MFRFIMLSFVGKVSDTAQDILVVDVSNSQTTTPAVEAADRSLGVKQSAVTNTTAVVDDVTPAVNVSATFVIY